MAESQSKDEKPEKQRRFVPELLKKGLRCDLDQYEMLKRCSEKKDITEWNEWRKEHPDKDILLEGSDLSKCYLKKVLLNTGVFQPPDTREFLEFRGGVHLEHANLDLIHLEGANFSYAHLEKSSVFAAHLEGADLSYAQLEGAVLDHAYLEEGELNCANLEGVDFIAANLQSAKSRFAALRNANLYKAVLKETDLTGANMESAYLKNADLEDAILTGAHLEGADLDLANLEGADLRGAHLEEVTFLETNMKGSNLLETHIEGANLKYANLENANFRRAVVDGSTVIWKCKVDRYRHCEGEEQGTDFNGVGLDRIRIDPETKQLLEYNIRRMNWEEWYRKENVPIVKGGRIFSNDKLRKVTNRFLKYLIKKFWGISDYGRSAWKIIKVFLRLATYFAIVYYAWGFIDYYFVGIKDYPGIVSELFVLEDKQETVSCWLVPFRAVYFSVVTMTTLGFGDMYANAHSFLRGLFGHMLLALQVILGYVLLGALVTRFAVLFTAGGPVGLFADEKATDDRRRKTEIIPTRNNECRIVK